MSRLGTSAVPFLSVAVLLTAVADTELKAPATGEAILMPIAGVPDSQVYVYPITAGPRAPADAAREQLQAFAAMFHTADPRTYQGFLDKWGSVVERRAMAVAARLSGEQARPDPRSAGDNR